MSEASPAQRADEPGDEPAAVPLVEAAHALLESARLVPFTYRALFEFSSTFDPASEVTEGAFREAIAGRRAEEFTRLYVACGMAGRLPGAWVLAQGTPLFTELNVLIRTALDLEGDLRGAVLEAVSSGRLNHEREASLYLLLWRWREKHGITETDHELLKAQRRSAISIRKYGGLGFAVGLMQIVGAVSGDPDLVRLMGYEDAAPREELEPSISAYRRSMSRPLSWRKLVPANLVAPSRSGGGTVTRIADRVGRNEPCPCGSGKKYKKCCAGKEGSAADYAIDGRPLDLLKANPELALNEYQVQDMRAYELYQLDPCKLAQGVLEEVVRRLILFREGARAREMLEAGDASCYGPDFLDEIAVDFTEAGDLESLRWLRDHPELEYFPYFKAEVLLAERDCARELIIKKVIEAHRLNSEGELGARVAFVDIAEGAAALDPALGLILARGALPYAESIHFDLIAEIIDSCRVELGLEGDDPSFAWMDNEYDSEEQKAKHRHELEKQRAEAEKRVAKRQSEAAALKKKLADLQTELAKRERAEKEARKKLATQATARAGTEAAAAAARADGAKLDELREQARMLKGNLKQEHEDHARDREALRIAQQELSRLKTKQSRDQSKSSEHGSEDAKEQAQLGELVEPSHTPCLPCYSDAFRQSLERFDHRTVASAITLAGKLAAADPHAWHGVRKLRGKPDTLRQRVGRNHRLLFKLGRDTLEIVELIDRRDLDRWIARS